MKKFIVIMMLLCSLNAFAIMKPNRAKSFIKSLDWSKAILLDNDGQDIVMEVLPNAVRITLTSEGYDFLIDSMQESMNEKKDKIAKALKANPLDCYNGGPNEVTALVRFFIQETYYDYLNGERQVFDWDKEDAINSYEINGDYLVCEKRKKK